MVARACPRQPPLYASCAGAAKRVQKFLEIGFHRDLPLARLLASLLSHTLCGGDLARQVRGTALVSMVFEDLAATNL